MVYGQPTVPPEIYLSARMRDVFRADFRRITHLLQPSLAMPNLSRPKKQKKPKISNRSPKAQGPRSLSSLWFFWFFWFFWSGQAGPGQAGAGGSSWDWAGLGPVTPGWDPQCRADTAPCPPLSQLAVGLAKLALAGLVGVRFLIALCFFLFLACSWSRSKDSLRKSSSVQDSFGTSSFG